jgi:hypothetical protein
MLGNGWLLVVFFLGSTVGVGMGLVYPFSLAVKISMVLGLLLSLTAIILGLKNCHGVKGQVSVVVGVLTWALIGIMGLGTGT